MKNKQEKINNKKADAGTKISMSIMLLAGIVCGLAGGLLMARAEEQGLQSWVAMLALLFGLYGGMLIQIIVHEMGHLAFGLATGYKFSSFRIGSLMLKKENGKLRLCKYSLAGTGGQCLMSPPDLVDGKMPVLLFNYGGCINNLIISALFCINAYLHREDPIEFIVYICIIVMGIAFALTNGIPMQVGPISNDGHNALSLGKNPKAMRAFWLQLKINEQQAKGVRLKDMPVEWFAVPEDEDLNNGIVAATAVFHANWLMDQLRVEESLEYIKELLAKETAVLGLYRSLLTCDRIYCELVVNQNVVEAVRLHDKEYEKFVKQMKNFPSIIRTEYAYALLAEKDEKKAASFKEQFDKMAKNYPYPNDIESERELIEEIPMMVQDL